MIYTKEVEHMCPVNKGAYHGPAPIPQEGKWTQVKEIKDISGLTHAIAAECVMPEQPIVSTSASSMMPSFTFRVSLQAPC